MGHLSLCHVLEKLASDVYISVDGDQWTKRVAVSHACGILDAKHMVYMMQTFGYPVWAYVDAMKQGEATKYLKIPWEMLSHELLCIGKSKTSIQSMLNEIRFGLDYETSRAEGK